MLRHRVLRGTKRERKLLSGRPEVRILSWVPYSVENQRFSALYSFLSMIVAADIFLNFKPF